VDVIYSVTDGFRRRSVFGRLYHCFFVGNSVAGPLSTIQSSIIRLEQTMETNFSVIVNVQVDMNSVEIMSSQSDRAFHLKKFEEEIANNYQCKDPVDSNVRRCVVTNHFHPIKFMCQAVHILPLSQRNKLKVVGMHPTEVWNWRNGLCLHREIDKRYEALDLVLNFNIM